MAIYPHIMVNDLSNIVAISERNIKDNISKLNEKGLHRRIGPDKGGPWNIEKEIIAAKLGPSREQVGTKLGLSFEEAEKVLVVLLFF